MTAIVAVVVATTLEVTAAPREAARIAVVVKRGLVKSRAMPDGQVRQGCGASPTGVGFGVAALPVEAEIPDLGERSSPPLPLAAVVWRPGKARFNSLPNTGREKSTRGSGRPSGGRRRWRGQTADVGVSPVHAVSACPLVGVVLHVPIGLLQPAQGRGDVKRVTEQ